MSSVNFGGLARPKITERSVSSERKPIRLAQEMPGLAVVSVRIRAHVPVRTEKQSPAFQYLAHRQDIPGTFRNNQDRYKINLGFAASCPAVVVVDAQPVESPHQAAAGFHLYPPQVSSALHDEVVAMQVPVGQRQREAQAGGLVHEGHFAKLALKGIRAPAPQPSVPGRALLGRWNASA
jgi:hypothetical protein